VTAFSKFSGRGGQATRFRPKTERYFGIIIRLSISLNNLVTQLCFQTIYGKKNNCTYKLTKISISEMQTNTGYGKTLMSIVMLCVWNWIHCLLDDVLYQNYTFSFWFLLMIQHKLWCGFLKAYLLTY
jgi:hypothetical protein